MITAPKDIEDFENDIAASTKKASIPVTPQQNALNTQLENLSFAELKQEAKIKGVKHVGVTKGQLLESLKETGAQSPKSIKRIPKAEI